MTADEFERAIIDRNHREPFQPFVIELLNGTRYEVVRRFSAGIRDGVAGCFSRGRLILHIPWDEVRQVVDIPMNAVAS
jgi:hypothetical protein